MARRAKISASLKRAYRAGRVKRSGWSNPEASRMKRSSISKAMWANPEMRRRILERRKLGKTNKGRQWPKEMRDRISASVKKRWADGAYEDAKWPPSTLTKDHLRRMRDGLARMPLENPEGWKRRGERISKAKLGHSITGESRKKISRTMISRWKEPKVRAKFLEARRRKPNGLESSVLPILKSLGFRYTGDGTFWVHTKSDGSRNPDFKKTGEHQVIEIFGDYWHRGDSAEETIRWYSKRGFSCVVIWEKDLKNKAPQELHQAVLGHCGNLRPSQSSDMVPPLIPP